MQRQKKTATPGWKGAFKLERGPYFNKRPRSFPELLENSVNQKGQVRMRSQLSYQPSGGKSLSPLAWGHIRPWKLLPGQGLEILLQQHGILLCKERCTYFSILFGLFRGNRTGVFQKALEAVNTVEHAKQPARIKPEHIPG